MADFVVDILIDENDGFNQGTGTSLRDAINGANADQSDVVDTITFHSDLEGKTISLTVGELKITDDVTIEGLGADQLTIDAGKNNFRVFNVDDSNNSSPITVTIDGLTITGGNAAGEGGAIFNREELNVRNSTISGNNSSSDGGGIYNNAILNLTNSTISNNQSGNDGGGIYTSNGVANVTNSTISNNQSGNDGGGIYTSNGVANVTNSTISTNTGNNGSGIYATSSTTDVTNSTITNNSVSSSAVANVSETFNVTSTIIAGNSGNNDLNGTFTSKGNNLIGNGDGGNGFTNGTNNDIVGTTAAPINPLLGELTNNGGSTETHLPNAGSPALNKGSNPNNLTTDQRGTGNPRDDGGGVDIGAVECFLTGTLILTDKGEIAVENLQIGYKVVTSEGKLEPVKWIGKQTREPHQVRNPLRGFPILIKAGALGNNLPHRDLYVSPDHAMFFEGVLINAGALVNGTSIVKTEPTETFTYYHVELENHALLLAEGASAESYLPQQEDRFSYDNGAEYEELYPHGSNLMLWPMDYPRISSKNKVPRYMRKKLNLIAEELGLVVKVA